MNDTNPDRIGAHRALHTFAQRALAGQNLRARLSDDDHAGPHLLQIPLVESLPSSSSIPRRGNNLSQGVDRQLGRLSASRLPIVPGSSLAGRIATDEEVLLAPNCYHDQLRTSAKHPQAPKQPLQSEPTRAAGPIFSARTRTAKIAIQHRFHHTHSEQHAHQRPTTSKTINSVPQSHAQRAAGPIAPIRHKESERALAMCQTSAFPGSQLIDACGDQNAAAQMSADKAIPAEDSIAAWCTPTEQKSHPR